MLFKEIVVFNYASRTTSSHSVGENAQSLYVKTGGTYIQHWTLTIKYFVLIKAKFWAKRISLNDCLRFVSCDMRQGNLSCPEWRHYSRALEKLRENSVMWSYTVCILYQIWWDHHTGQDENGWAQKDSWEIRTEF
jgi:hypothetical protein